MDEKDLVRAVAGEFGVKVETVNMLEGRTRAFDDSETMIIATFVAQCAQLAVQILPAVKDRAPLQARLEAEARAYPSLDAEKRRCIIRRIAEILTGTT